MLKEISAALKLNNKWTWPHAFQNKIHKMHRRSAKLSKFTERKANSLIFPRQGRNFEILCRHMYKVITKKAIAPQTNKNSILNNLFWTPWGVLLKLDNQYILIS